LVTQHFEQRTRELIDSLKAICAAYGFGNDGNEFKIITQVFLYKFLNDKFAFVAKKIRPQLAKAESWEAALAALSVKDLDMLQMRMGPDTARLKPEHFIAHLFGRQNAPEFAKLFDDTLRDIAISNNDIFAVKTDGGSKITLFDRVSEFITDPSKRDAFCRAIINKLGDFSFERIFNERYDFYAALFEYLIKDYNKDSGGKYAEYYTPHAVAKIMAAILVPEAVRGKVSNVSCYDPSAGSGTLLMNIAHAIGEPGRCAIWKDQVPGMKIQKALHRVRAHRSYSNEFIYYRMQLAGRNGGLSKHFIGSTIKHLTGIGLKQAEFSCPSFEEQKQIAAVLSVLDVKIDFNNRINAELEGMAKTLYDYWFVQFDFPDANGKPYKSSGGKMVYNATLKREIPAGWEDGTLENLGRIVGRSTPTTENPANFTVNGTPWITPYDLSDNQANKFITRGIQDVSEEGIKNASLKKLPAGTVLLSSRAPIGYMAIARNELTTNQGFKSFVPTSGYSTVFIYYTVKSSLKTIAQYASGSTFKEISGAVLKTVKVCLPKSGVLATFTNSIEPTLKRQDLLELENQQLTQLRDWLLPLLMNGQATVA